MANLRTITKQHNFGTNMRLMLMLLLSMFLLGCSSSTPTNIVFDLSLSDPLPDGRPVVLVKLLNGAVPPPPARQSGAYVVLVRKNGKAFYTRMFWLDEIGDGLPLDLAMPQIFQPEDKLSAAVENVVQGATDDTVRLSNVLDVPQPGKDAPSFAIPTGNTN